MVINPIIGFYIPIIRIPIKGGMTIPNIATFDHGTHKPMKEDLGWSPIFFGDTFPGWILLVNLDIAIGSILVDEFGLTSCKFHVVFFFVSGAIKLIIFRIP